MLEELRSFVLFAQEGSVQKVAQRLPLTQPAVSRQIQRLEQAIGAPLLDRRQKPPALTPLGHEVLARSRAILDAIGDLKAIATTPEPEGVFRFGLVNGLAHDALAESFATIVRQFPRVSLRLQSGWSGELAEQHRLGTLDAAVILSDGSRFHDAEKIGEDHLVVIGASTSSVQSEQNKAQGFILSPEPCDARRSLATRLAGQDQPLVPAAEVEHAGLQLALVRQGIGLGLMPRRLLEAAKPQGIKEIDGFGGDLRLDVLLLRSPHLGAMAKVATAIADQIRMFIGQPT